jgi:pimeloyl-ACP methyl ester carboxylesterase
MDFFPNVLIGHSVDGMMGMVLTAEHPKEHTGMVLVDIAPFKSSESNSPLPPSYFATETAARDWTGEISGFTDSYVNNRFEHSLFEKDSKYFLKPRGDSVRVGLGIDLWPYVRRIETPTLLLIGEDSDLVTAETRKEMERVMPVLDVEVM